VSATADRTSYHCEIRLAPTTGAFERLVALLSRKAVQVDAIAATRSTVGWMVVANIQVEGGRAQHVFAAIEREPVVVSVGSAVGSVDIPCVGHRVAISHVHR
jgi:hypothetical protein